MFEVLGGLFAVLLALIHMYRGEWDSGGIDLGIGFALLANFRCSRLELKRSGESDDTE